MSMRVTAVVVVGLVALTALPRLGWPQASSAGFQRLWYQSYDEGVRSVLRVYGATNKSQTITTYVPEDSPDLKAAIASLEAAKRSGPAPARRVLFQGDRVDAFNPDYYLGLAYYASGRFAEAEAAFARVANDKLLVQGDPQWRDFSKLSARATFERLMADGERALRASRFADAEKVGTVASDPAGLLAIIDDDSLDGRASELVRRAKDGVARLAAVPQSPTNVGIDNAAPAATLLENDTRVAENDPKTPDVKGTDANATDTKAPDGKSPDVKVPDGKAPDPKVAANDPARPPATTRPQVPPDAPVFEDYATVTLRGATAYFEGNYDEAIRILTPAIEAEPPSSYVAFYMACSRAALVASGRADRSTLAEARRTFAWAGGGAMDRHLRFISPRVRELLGDVPATTR